jgi:arabinogalactan oligomer/maltooligosaccharide transport system permease protein
MVKGRYRHWLDAILAHSVLGIVCVVALFPIAYTLATSLKPESEVLTSPPTLLPTQWSSDGYKTVLFHSDMLRVYLPNTFINASLTAVLVVTLAALSAYTFSRHQFRYSRTLEWAILGLMMLPGVTYIIPYFRIAGQLNLLNTHTFIIAVYSAWGLPLAIWIIRSFIDAIPFELEEAALIDGCTPLQTLRFIVLPLAAPGLLAAGLIVFVETWNEFLMAVVLLTGDAKTATVGLYDFQSIYNIDYHVLTAASIVIMIPVLIIFLAIHRQFFRAMLTGGLKG